MQFFKSEARFMFFSILLIISCLSVSVVAQSNKTSASNDVKLFGLGGEIGYVAPYVWRGIPLTDGPCIQPQCWFSFKEFRLDMFINMFGSNKDRKGWQLNTKTLELTLDSGVASQSFGMINEINFSLNWEHSFNETFTLLAGYTQYAYGEYTKIIKKTMHERSYAWFHKNVRYGELTIRPSFNLGIVNLFTEQNITIAAPKRSFTYLKYFENDPWLDTVEVTDSRFGSYHGVFGVSLEKKLSNQLFCDLTVQQEIANRNFFETVFRDFKDPDKNETVSVEGLYQQTVNFSANYTPLPWFLLAVNFGLEFITKEALSDVTEAKGAFGFGGVHTKFAW